MIRTQRKLRICATLLALNLVFIWGNSLLPGSVSGAISHWLRDILALLLPDRPADPDAGHGLLRKLAHFTEFACLGALFTWLFGMLQKPMPLALLCGFAAAGIDETIQRFVPERGPSFRDVLIDTSGALVGMIFLLVGYTVFKTRRKPMEDDTI